MKTGPISAHARQFERHETAYEASIEPHADHMSQFRLSLPDAQAGIAVIDVSAGGVGLRSGVYVPKNMRLILHVMGVGADEGSTGETVKIRTIARRCVMVDYKPTYEVGLQFVDPSGQDETRLVKAVQSHFEAQDRVVVAGGGRGFERNP